MASWRDYGNRDETELGRVGVSIFSIASTGHVAGSSGDASVVDSAMPLSDEDTYARPWYGAHPLQPVAS